VQRRSCLYHVIAVLIFNYTNAETHRAGFSNTNYRTVRGSSPLQLEYPIRMIYDLCLLNDLPSQSLKLVMSGVIINVVVSILDAFKPYNKRVRDAILYNLISIGQERSEIIARELFWERRCHTWAPSGELSVPPDADLIYGFLDVG